MYNFAQIGARPEVSPRDRILIVHSDPIHIQSRLYLNEYDEFQLARNVRETIEKRRKETSYQLLITGLTKGEFRLPGFLHAGGTLRNVPIINLIPSSEEIQNPSCTYTRTHKARQMLESRPDIPAARVARLFCLKHFDRLSYRF